MRTSLSSRPIAHAVGVLALVAGAACHDVTPTTPPNLAPRNPALVLTGGTGTNLFPTAAPGDYQQRGFALGLNGVGQVTGGWKPSASDDDSKVFRWSAGTGATVVTATCCAGDKVGFDINDAGVITGRSYGQGIDAVRAFRATGDTMVNLPILPATTPAEVQAQGLAINNAGQIVGFSGQGTGSPIHAVIWSPSNVIQDLGTLGGTTSRAVDINGSGQVIGSSQIAGDAATHAFSWTAGGGMVDLNATIDASITSVVEINDAGQIVGTYATPSGQSHAFLYTPGAGLRDLGTLGGSTSAPTGLNNKGNVVGSSTLADGSTHAFLWTQTDGMEDITAVTGVPEVKRLNDNLQTLTGTQIFGYGMPRLVQLTVTGPANQPPVASFTVNCVGQYNPNQCAFDASASTDDKGIVSYKWDWGNGRSESHSGPTVRNTWTAPGVYTVTLTVTDAGGLTAAASKQVTVGANGFPTGDFTYSCVGQALPHQCAFDASSSTDSRGIVAYYWHWGNGRSEPQTVPTVRNTWAAAGIYTVTLVVMNADGNKSAVSRDVTVP